MIPSKEKQINCQGKEKLMKPLEFKFILMTCLRHQVKMEFWPKSDKNIHRMAAKESQWLHYPHE